MKKFNLIAVALMLVGGVVQAEANYTISKVFDSYYKSDEVKKAIDRDIKSMGHGISAYMSN